MIMKNLITLLLFILTSHSYIQGQTNDLHFSLIEFDTKEETLFSTFTSEGISIDHFKSGRDGKLQAEVSSLQMEKLQKANISFRVLIEDVYQDYLTKQTNLQNVATLRNLPPNIAEAFSFGSIGNFYTLSEVERELNKLSSNYPTIVKAKYSIGKSHEGRNIWALKISDNPNIDESATESAVYFDALTHAREPASMAVTLNYAMYLCENYGIDPEVTHLVDNRQIYFVPVVNPDGYFHNERKCPNGFGMTRKTRQARGGTCPDDNNNICGVFSLLNLIGVDLNRNHSVNYGNNEGSSHSPCSATYRGPNALSEPESRAIRDFVRSVKPTCAFSTHTYSDLVLISSDTKAFPIYSEYCLEMYEDNEYPYGVGKEMIGNNSSGTTRDFMHGEGIIAMTPELGRSFWPQRDKILPLLAKNLPPMKTFTWLSGAYPKVQSHSFQGRKEFTPGQLTNLTIEIQNKGVGMEATDIKVSISSNNPNVIPRNPELSYLPLAPRAKENNCTTPFLLYVEPQANIGESAEITVTVKQNEIITDSYTFTIFIGHRNELFSANGENGKTANNWTITIDDAYSGNSSYTDSPGGNSINDTTIYFKTPSINLTNAVFPKIQYAAKWSIIPSDYTQIQISRDNGNNWENLSSPNMQITAEGLAYIENSSWIYETIDLSSFVGSIVQLRFLHHTINRRALPGRPGHGDGFYFDDFEVIDYVANQTCFDEVQNGDETGIDCGGSNCVPCILESCPSMVFSNETVINYDPGQDFGAINIFDGGKTLYMRNNSWKAVELKQPITSNTILTFDFRSTIQGEIHEISFDNNLTVTPEHRVVVYGFQGYNGNIPTIKYSGSGNYESFSIPIGEYFTGDYKYLVLTADHDEIPSNGNSFWRNIRLFEDHNKNGVCDDENFVLSPIDFSAYYYLEYPNTNQTLGVTPNSLRSSGFLSMIINEEEKKEEKWQIEPICNGYVRLYHTQCELYLTENGANPFRKDVDLEPDNGQYSQHWKIKKGEDGTVIFENRASGLFLARINGIESVSSLIGSIENRQWTLNKVEHRFDYYPEYVLRDSQLLDFTASASIINQKYKLSLDAGKWLTENEIIDYFINPITGKPTPIFTTRLPDQIIDYVWKIRNPCLIDSMVINHISDCSNNSQPFQQDFILPKHGKYEIQLIIRKWNPYSNEIVEIISQKIYDTHLGLLPHDNSIYWILPCNEIKVDSPPTCTSCKITLHANQNIENQVSDLKFIGQHNYKISTYTVERSSNDINFQAIRQISATSEELGIYTSSDNILKEGAYTYRIKGNLKNGDQIYSNSQKLIYPEIVSFSIFPNPATSFINVNLQNYLGNLAEIEILNLEGKIVFKKASFKINKPLERIQLGNIGNGTHYLHLKMDGRRSISKKFIVINED